MTISNRFMLAGNSIPLIPHRNRDNQRTHCLSSDYYHSTSLLQAIPDSCHERCFQRHKSLDLFCASTVATLYSTEAARSGSADSEPASSSQGLGAQTPEVYEGHIEQGYSGDYSELIKTIIDGNGQCRLTLSVVKALPPLRQLELPVCWRRSLICLPQDRPCRLCRQVDLPIKSGCIHTVCHSPATRQPGKDTGSTELPRKTSNEQHEKSTK
ncbi:hypothetical protein LIA77_07143 [Sarocladium implicatum]|nr:hypothetical protein LIA77_07143 [Sarocladium implicatum]